jgi:hypothetical protein
VVAGIGEETPWNDLKGQCLLGGKKFLKRLVPYLKQKNALKEVPVIDRHLHRPELKELFPADVRSTFQGLLAATTHTASRL